MQTTRRIKPLRLEGISSVLWILLLLLPTSLAFAQVKFKIPIVYTDSIFTGATDLTDTTGLTFSATFVDTLWYGYHTQATICRDTLNGFSTHWTLADTGTIMEELLPPISPGGQDVRFIPIDLTRQGCFTDGSRADIRTYIGSGQRDSLRFKTTANPDPSFVHREVLRWPTFLSQYFDSCRIRNVGGAAVNIEMTQESKAISILFNAALVTNHNFRIIPSGPKVPPPTVPTVVLLSPSNGALFQPTSLSLTWNASAGALFYRIQLSKGDPLFGSTHIVLNDSIGAGTLSKAVSNLTPSATYYWRVAVFTAGGVSYFQDPPYNFTCQGTSDVKDRGSNAPVEFRLEQNYPDPFNPTTTIHYAIPAQGHVRLSVHSMLGEEVAVLVDEVRPAGAASVVFDARALPSGTYFYRLNAGRFSDVKKMQIIK